jgi:hypothetical protein
VSAAWKASVKKGCSLLLSTYESSSDNAGGANQQKETSLHSSVGENLFLTFHSARLHVSLSSSSLWNMATFLIAWFMMTSYGN